MHERLHVDLFSGIGGFALAARANGIRTVQFVEIDRRCREFLSRAWPGVAIHDDIRTFCRDGVGLADTEALTRWGKSDNTSNGSGGGCGDEPGPAPRARRLPVWLLTGGVPCQPASRAGKQRGAEDDRWLWPEAIRVLAAVRPTWALFENPPGIGDVGISGILAEMEAVGYEVRVFGIPACAVGAPHRRERYWIVAHANEPGREGADARAGRIGQDGLCAEHREGDMGDSYQERRDGRAWEQRKGWWRESADASAWFRFVWLPCADGKFRRAPDDSFGLVDGLHRSILGALGNSIVPALAAKIINAMVLAEEEE